MSFNLNDLLVAVKRGDVDAFDALVLAADTVEHQLAADPLLTTQEREALEAGVEIADNALRDVAADIWAAEEFAGLATTHERSD